VIVFPLASFLTAAPCCYADVWRRCILRYDWSRVYDGWIWLLLIDDVISYLPPLLVGVLQPDQVCARTV